MMESDELNPRASNGRCHGIIQFCEGPARRAPPQRPAPCCPRLPRTQSGIAHPRRSGDRLVCGWPKEPPYHPQFDHDRPAPEQPEPARRSPRGRSPQTNRVLNLPSGPERNLTGAVTRPAAQRQDLAARSAASAIQGLKATPTLKQRARFDLAR